MASNRSNFFKAFGHHGFVVTHGSIKATWPEGVVSENVLWPKYVTRLPVVLSIFSLSNSFQHIVKFGSARARLGVSWNRGPAAFEWPPRRRPAGLHRTYVPPACRLCRRRTLREEIHSNLEALPA